MTGASGLVGRALSKKLQADGFEVVPLVRDRARTGIYWNPETGEIEESKMTGADFVIHLAGENISEHRWTQSFKAKIMESRTQGTRLLVDTLRKLKQPPRCLVSASAVGYYASSGDQTLSEESPSGDNFLSQVCQAWEAEADKASSFTRVVKIRIGVVLSPEGGALQKMLPIFKLGLGGSLGSGQQYLPWIHLDDIVGAVRFLLNREDLTGAFNLSAPEPVPQSTFAHTLGEVLGRPARLPTPEWALRLATGEMADALLLSSFRVIPARLQKESYAFKFADLKAALIGLLKV